MTNMTPTLKRVLDLAAIEASKDNSFLSVNHVLIGIMLEGYNSASITLGAAGFTVESFREGRQNEIEK